MDVAIRMTEKEIRQALSRFILDQYNIIVDPEVLHIEVKSKQNYKSEWEKADIRMAVEVPARKPG